ncbi:beta-ketoacyl-ACP synthase I [Thalassobaculum sp. OXR-137]|uniref:beta-ketoacyl-ACP synthase I n=1 Tax=Thalassobaculum sp. OXR-137 TaxID=3100173 RepID=UPI002AC9EDF1|nr:beta-ketoacyl-ACP synthase I [Thalassobaculum sp. OXR-137]WPZ35669.1 beta-ketoacyl-ACP synthase I [Thalassobaculum sp. OXR-137]
MRRVVVTGVGVVSPIGNDKAEVTESLKTGRSGITFAPEYKEMGFRSHVHGSLKLNLEDRIDRKLLRFMGDGAAYNYLAMEEAIADSGLETSDISNPRTGLIMGSGGPSTRNMMQAFDTAREKSPKRVGPYMVPRVMSSTNSANLSTIYKIKGLSYSISSACSTSSHCIGNGVEMIQYGKQDIVFAGGGEELHWTLSVLFDAMGALSSKYNETPEKASRPYDTSRDGFVIAGGGGVVVLEELEHAKARGAKIYGEVVGYGATSDGADMVAPSGEGGLRAMQLALADVHDPVDYINTHGTSTPVGDMVELTSIAEVFRGQNKIPYISSTKSMTGHSQGATGVHEAIYTLLMMQGGFIAPSINIESMEPEAEAMPIVREPMLGQEINVAMSNSFGFGGTNAVLAFRRADV